MTQIRRGFWDWYKVWILPGFIFQSVVMGGGYASGRETVEYFTRFGGAGFKGIFITYLVWAVAMAAAFEICRVFKVYDYRKVVKVFLWKAWPAFDVIYVYMIILTLAVMLAAGGSALHGVAHISNWWGVAVIFIGTLVLCYRGRRAIEGYMGVFSVYLYGIFIAIFVGTMVKYGSSISAGLSISEPGAYIGGLKYGMYNLGVVIACLFLLDVFKTRKQTIGSSFVASLIAVLPGLAGYIATMSLYPEVKEIPLPLLSLTTKLGGMPFMIAYLVMLLATLIETSTGLLHAFNERIDSWHLDLRGVHMKAWQRVTSTVGMLIVGLVVSSFGLIALVAKGYGTMSYAYIIVFFVPLVTLGVFRAFHPAWKAEFWTKAK